MNYCRFKITIAISILTLSFVVATHCLSFASDQQKTLTSPSSSIILTAEEQAWLENHSRLTIALDDSNPPMNFRQDDGQYAGISVEYLRVIGEKIGIKINFWGSTWDKALRRALDHEVDGIMTASVKEDRKPYLNFTDPYVTTPVVMATLKDFKKIDSLGDFDGMTIAVVRGTIRTSMLNEYCPNSLVLEVDSPDKGIKLLSEGKVTAFFDDLPVVQHSIESNLLTNLKIALLYYSDAGAARVGLRNDHPELLSIFNKAIAGISEEEHRGIRSKWFTLSEGAVIEHELKLTDSEKNWLKEHPIIRVATDPEWRPIEFLDNDGEFKGIAIDYLKRIEGRLGVKFEIVRGYSWAELIEKGKTRELDMFSCVTATPERKKYLLFTEPYLSFPGAIFTRNNTPYIGNLRELDNKKVAVVNGYAFHDFLRRNNPDIDLVTVDSTRAGLQMLEEDKVTAYVGNLLVSSYYIAERGSISLKVAGETPFRYDLGFATRSDWPEFSVILQKALNSLSADDKQQIYKRWVSFSYEKKVDKKIILQIIVAFITIFTCTLIIIQRRQLKSRKTAMQEIARRKAEFEAIFNSITDAIVFVDTQRHIIRTNPAFTMLFGYDSEEAIGKSTKFLYADPEDYFRHGDNRFDKDAKFENPTFENRYIRKDGSFFVGETLGVHVIDEAEDLLGFLGVIRDITERKRMMEELGRSSQLIALGTVAAGVAHEINNPIQGIMNYAGLIKRNPDCKKRNLDISQRIITESERIAKITQDLLYYSKDNRVEMKLVDIKETIESALSFIATKIRHEGISLEFNIQDDLPNVVLQPQSIQQVLINLIGNATDALRCKSGAADKKAIHVYADIIKKQGGEEMVIEVCDNGIGMSEEVLQKSQEAFFTTKPPSEGTGLGLSIVRDIVKKHNGHIDIESEEGEYTRIKVILPAIFEEPSIS